MKRIVVVTDARDARGNKANGIRVAEALAALGHSVAVASHEGAAKGEPLAGADLVLAFGTLLRAERQRPGYFRRIRKAKPPNAAFALWYFDLCCPGMLNSPWKNEAMRAIAPELDWLIMTDHSYAWERHARNFLHLMQGVSPAEFSQEPEGQFSRPRDVIFTGGTQPPFQDRQKALAGLRRRFSLGIYGRDAGQTLFGAAFWREHQRSKVVFVPKPPSWAPRRYWSNRIYLATATGTPAVAGWTEGLEDHFKDGRDVLFYQTQRELEDAVGLLVEDAGARIRIGRAGRERTLRDHTYRRRAEDLMQAIFGRKT